MCVCVFRYQSRKIQFRWCWREICVFLFFVYACSPFYRAFVGNSWIFQHYFTSLVINFSIDFITRLKFKYFAKFSLELIKIRTCHNKIITPRLILFVWNLKPFKNPSIFFHFILKLFLVCVNSSQYVSRIESMPGTKKIDFFYGNSTFTRHLPSVDYIFFIVFHPFHVSKRMHWKWRHKNI